MRPERFLLVAAVVAIAITGVLAYDTFDARVWRKEMLRQQHQIKYAAQVDRLSPCPCGPNCPCRFPQPSKPGVIRGEQN